MGIRGQSARAAAVAPPGQAIPTTVFYSIPNISILQYSTVFPLQSPARTSAHRRGSLRVLVGCGRPGLLGCFGGFGRCSPAPVHSRHPCIHPGHYFIMAVMVLAYYQRTTTKLNVLVRRDRPLLQGPVGSRSGPHCTPRSEGLACTQQVL